MHSIICQGRFAGGEIEPGTFHGGTVEKGTFHGVDLPLKDNAKDQSMPEDEEDEDSESDSDEGEGSPRACIPTSVDPEVPL